MKKCKHRYKFTLKIGDKKNYFGVMKCSKCNDEILKFNSEKIKQ